MVTRDILSGAEITMHLLKYGCDDAVTALIEFYNDYLIMNNVTHSLETFEEYTEEFFEEDWDNEINGIDVDDWFQHKY